MHDISLILRKAVNDVFMTMLLLHATPYDDVSEEITTASELEGISGTVSVAGKMTGIVYLNFTEALAKKAGSQVLGRGASVSDEALSDIIGELTNMVTGNLKSHMCDRGFNCALTIPSVIRGKHISLQTQHTPIQLQNHFDVGGEKLVVLFFGKLEN
jgi:chemotaxis protein CheX